MRLMANVDKGYEFFEHTADVGIRASGQTLQELFIRMAQGLVELIAEDSQMESREVRQATLAAEDAASLLLVWLQELLFWFSTDRFLPMGYTFGQMTETTLRGEVRGNVFDPARHVQGREVKAITRHLLSVEQRGGVWHGQVIVDI